MRYWRGTARRLCSLHCAGARPEMAIARWRPAIAAAFVPGMLRTWVQRAGFEDAMLFAVAPSADEPEELRPFTLADYVAAPAFVVVAGASRTPGGILLDHAVQAMEGARSRIGRVTPADVTRLINSSRGKSLAIVERNDIGVVVRVARAPVIAKTRGSYRLIEQLQQNAVVRDVVPRPLGEAAFGDFAFFAQSRLPGTPLSGVDRRREPLGLRARGRTFLRGLNVDLPGRAPLPFDPTKSRRPCDPWSSSPGASRRCEAEGADAAARATPESLRGARGSLGIVHGDFGTANILVDRQRVTGVIDWEAARFTGLPILDAFNYLDTAHQSCRRNNNTVDNISLLASGSWPVAEEAEFLRSMFEFCGIDTGFQRGLALLYALFHFGPQLRFASADGPRKRLEQGAAVVRGPLDLNIGGGLLASRDSRRHAGRIHH